MQQLRRGLRAISNSIWLMVIGVVLLALIILSLTRAKSGVDEAAFQPTLDVLATQTNQAAPTISARLTLTPPEARLEEAAPTLELIGRQEVAQFAAAVSSVLEGDPVLGGTVQAVGPPNTEDCTDSQTAWIPSGNGGAITLLYAQTVVPSHIRIHQTYNTGLITSVSFMDIYGELYTVYQSTPQSGPCAAVLDIPIEDIVEPGNLISIVVAGSTQIDAVELIGVKY